MSECGASCGALGASQGEARQRLADCDESADYSPTLGG
jgi:hypothetical protein